ncbi:FMN-binding protein [Candidatus Nephthysia bennettiae]|uniref:FMN-binding protein n=1 Tax=Candidatus Nephthysia bennettiae TaxID=3127016 RepID=UPI003312FEC1
MGLAPRRSASTPAPALRSEAIQAQSANVDIVSGATYTSEAYAESLNAALQQAYLA